MKKVYLLVLFLVPFLAAQQNNKGDISLVYNGEKIDLPVKAITIHKDNRLSLVIETEQNDSAARNTVSLELALNELSSGPDAERLDGTAIKITTENKSADTGNEFYVRFSDDRDKSEAYYGVINKGKKLTWEINSVSLEINITDVKYSEDALQISGEFHGTFKSKDAPEGQIAEIKDCRFKIKI